MISLPLALFSAIALGASPPSISEASTTPQTAGLNDVALVVGIEDYAYVPDVPYAERDARAFATYLLRDRGVPSERVRLLLNEKGSKENIEEAIEFLARNAHPEGHLWVYFAGHGMPSLEGQDGLLAGPEVQQSLKAIQARSVSRRWLVNQLSRMPAAKRIMLLDACFSGRSRDGAQVISQGERPLLPVAPLIPDTSVLVFSAAGADEVSGPYERVRHGLFTYFAVGGLKGWADLDGDRDVTARELAVYVRRGASTVLADGSRSQNPVVNAEAGDTRLGWALASGARESGPHLPDLSPVVAASATQAIPNIALSAVPALSGKLKAGGGGAIDLSVDTEALVLYDTAIQADATGKEKPEAAATAWEALAAWERQNPYRQEAMGRARQWREFADRKRALAIQQEADDERLRKVLPLSALSLERKEQLILSYGSIYGEEAAPRLIQWVQPTDVRAALCRKLVGSVGAEVAIVMPEVYGSTLEGEVLLDDVRIGSAPGTVRLPDCATTLRVAAEGGHVWEQPVTQALSMASGGTLRPVFPTVVDDTQRGPAPKLGHAHTYLHAELIPFQRDFTLPTFDYPRVSFRVGHQFVFPGFEDPPTAAYGDHRTDPSNVAKLVPVIGTLYAFMTTLYLEGGMTFLSQYATVWQFAVGSEFSPVLRFDYVEWTPLIGKIGLGTTLPTTSLYVPLSIETRVRYRTGYLFGATQLGLQLSAGFFWYVAGSTDTWLTHGARFSIGPEF